MSIKVEITERGLIQTNDPTNQPPKLLINGQEVVTGSVNETSSPDGNVKVVTTSSSIDYSFDNDIVETRTANSKRSIFHHIVDNRNTVTNVVFNTGSNYNNEGLGIYSVFEGDPENDVDEEYAGIFVGYTPDTGLGAKLTFGVDGSYEEYVSVTSDGVVITNIDYLASLKSPVMASLPAKTTADIASLDLRPLYIQSSLTSNLGVVSRGPRATWAVSASFSSATLTLNNNHNLYHIPVNTTNNGVVVQIPTSLTPGFSCSIRKTSASNAITFATGGGFITPTFYVQNTATTNNCLIHIFVESSTVATVRIENSV